MDLERERNELYKRKLKDATEDRDDKIQEIISTESEIGDLINKLGQGSYTRQPEEGRNLNEKLAPIRDAYKELQGKMYQREDEFRDVLLKIEDIKFALKGVGGPNVSSLIASLSDYSDIKLAHYWHELDKLQTEKSERVQQINSLRSTLNSDCSVLGMDPTASDLPGESISNKTTNHLMAAVEKLGKIKRERIERIRKLGITLSGLWMLLKTTTEDQQRFQHIISNSNRGALAGSLSEATIKEVEEEVHRLQLLKLNSDKLVLAKRAELKKLYKNTHLLANSEIDTLDLENL
ncbi:PREDICTED: 65-kDa microtubule-associated protein 3-like [Camelina sativa]|uniref:65-kDa microtubule-associated protein 3-like n=1 Tax=Camelina sativa TaxID=90675 RepID=A0ABM0UPI3_CAMSA|nr:PREDICTED: 65-kDa microtubule-associated protein 3-like [Camelina sativa]